MPHAGVSRHHRASSNWTNFVDRVIASDETWIFEYDLKTKCQSKSWNFPMLLKSESKIIKDKSQNYIDSTLWCEVHCQEGVLATGHPAAYASFSVWEEMLCQNKSWLLHYDNAPALKALSIWQFLAQRKITTLEQLLYSPDLALLWLFFFSTSSMSSSRGPIFKVFRPSIWL